MHANRFACHRLAHGPAGNDDARVATTRPSKDPNLPAVTIASIDTIALRIPLDTWAPPPQFAGRPRTHVEMLLVRVTTSNGVVGWGECVTGSSSRVIPYVFESLDQACRDRTGCGRPRA